MTELMSDINFIDTMKEILNIKAGLYLIAEEMHEGLVKEKKKAVMA